MTTVDKSRNDFVMERIIKPMILSYSRDSKGKVINRHTKNVANAITSEQFTNTQQYVLEQAKKSAKGKRNGTDTAVIEDNGNIRSCYFDEKGKNHSISEGVFCYDKNPSNTVTTQGHNSCYGESTDFRIRKLTPLEVGRLMDVDDADIRKIQAAGISETQQFKMFGNSICVNVLYHIFRKMFVETENENQQLTLF